MYKFFIVYTNREQQPVGFEDDFVTALKNKDVTDIFHVLDEKLEQALNKGEKLYVVYNNTSNIYCREELISHVKNAAKKTMPFCRQFVRPVLYIKVDNNTKIAVDALGKFVNHAIGNIHIRWVEDAVVLLYKINYSRLHIDLWVLSFLLYIIRNPALLGKMLETFKEEKYAIGVLYSFLQNEFLEHPEIGDGSNHPVALSLFCYMMGDSQYFLTSEATGPAYAAFCGTPVNKLISYIKHVYLEKFPRRESMSEYRNSTPSYFLDGFDSIMDLVRNRKES